MCLWGMTYAFDEAGAHAGNRPLDFFVARRAHDERAARVDGREKRIAVLEAVLEIAADLETLGRYPGEFIALNTNQHGGKMMRQ